MELACVADPASLPEGGTVELIFLFLIFVSLGVLDAVVGADSRDGLDWKPRPPMPPR